MTNEQSIVEAQEPVGIPAEGPSPNGKHGPSRLVIITGISGSGKSQALRTFEDLGYFCVDNMPPALLPALSDHADGKTPKIAVVVDVRAGGGLEDLEPALEELGKRSVSATILFLESSDPVLINRFKETRR